MLRAPPNKEFLATCVIFQTDLHCFSLTWSLCRDNVEFRVLSVDLSEAAEFRDYSLVALSVLY